MTLERSFPVNRFWPIVYLPALLIIILILTGCVLFFGATSLFFAMELPNRIGQCVMSFFAAVMFAGMFLYLCGLLEVLLNTIRAGGPALTVSSEGFRYLLASDDLIPWTAIEDVAIEWHWGIDTLIRFQIDAGFADTLHWRGRIANSFKPGYVSVRFQYIGAPTAEVEEALLRPLQSKSVRASSAVLSKADALLSRNYGALAASSRQKT